MTNLQETLLSNCHRTATQNQINDCYTGYLTMGIIMISSAPITVILNTVTVYMFVREKRTKTIADILLCFLTITDIIGGLVAMPLFSLESILRAKNIEKPCSIFLMRKLVGFLSGDINLVTSTFLVLDRYYAIFRPYSYDAQKDRIGTATLAVLSSWFVTTLICSLSIITTNYNLAIISGSTLLFFFVFVSAWVHLKVFIRSRQIQQEIASKRNNFARSNSETNSWHQIKGTRITFVMFCGVFLCYVPQIFSGSLLVSTNYSRPSLITFHCTTAVFLFNSIANPMMYTWQMKWFRHALRKTILRRNASVVPEWKLRAELFTTPNWLLPIEQKYFCNHILQVINW